MRVKISVIILLISLLVGITSFLYINSSCRTLISLTDTAIECIKKNDTESVDINVKNIEARYKKSLTVFNIFLNQSDTLSLQNTINIANAYVKINDYDSAILYLFEYKNILNGIIINNTPSVATIF